jgi:uroporphyrinogen III methyltransferase/synthase
MTADSAYRVLYTRPEATPVFEDLLQANGISVLRIPCIRIEAPESWEDLDHALADIRSYDGVILTSMQAVHWFTKRLEDNGFDAATLPPVHVVGPKTAVAATEAGLTVQELPSAYYGETLAEELSDVPGKCFLQPTSDIARDELVQVIRARGGEVEQITVYRTLPPTEEHVQKLREATEAGFDCVAFFSPSAVRHFVHALPDWLQQSTVIAAIGATTADAVASVGLSVSIVSAQPTAESLAEAIAEYAVRSAL